MNQIFRKIKKILLIATISLICLFPLGLLVIIPLRNEVVLYKYSKYLKDYDLGIDYEIIETDSVCGKLSGNGNGMQYLSAQLIYSEIQPIIKNTDGDVILEVCNSDFMDEYNPGDYLENIKKKLADIEDTDNYYIIYSFYEEDFDSIWNMDIRAH